MGKAELVSTGLEALDRLLGSGYPSKSAILVEGPSGNEKGAVAYKFLRSGLNLDDSCVYVSRVTSGEVIEDARAFGIDLHNENLVWMCSQGSQARFAANDLASISFSIKEVLKESKDKRLRIIFDLLSQLLMMHPVDDVYKFVSQLLAEIKKHDAVVLATIEEGMHPGQILASMELAFDGVIALRPKGEGRVEVQIKKMRGAGISSQRIEVRLSSQKEDTVTSEKQRIAILPFLNISADPNDEYFADEMTEELISTISTISGLHVISRTSAMQYKNNLSKKIVDIGRELDVGAVVEGSVRKSSGQVRIAVQLIDTQTDEHLWSESYNRRFEDIFAIQSDISQRVASSLKVRLLQGEKKQIQRIATTDTEAHNAYFKGRFFWRQRTNEGLGKATEYFKFAIERDKDYALSYSGLADCYTASIVYGHLTISGTLAKQRNAAMKSVEIDENLAEAHNSLAISLALSNEFGESEKEFKRALELNPNYFTAHQWYA